ncbi:hypothetical protein GGH96_002230 [Coemansia sp. RSA 1972]|nr:hypothetical protein GGH96_002230 [Coemansia sp. RSA 1972]
MLPSLSIFLGRSQRPQVGVFSGTPHKPAPHLGVSLLFEDIKAAPAHTRPGARTMTTESSADRTFAIVKPDALTPFKFQQIDALIKLNEFETVRQKLIWLTEGQAEALFPGRAAEDDGREWLQYITGAPCLALELAKPDAPLFWQLTMGADDPASGARDSDSIRGILAVDRIRNAVDGSQEPEDAAKQLELVFSDAVPALDYNNFLMQRADDTHATLALIKPDISRNEDAVAHVIGRAIARGYTIKDRVELTLSRAQATAFYAEHEGKPFFDGLIEFMTSGPVIALLLDGDDAVRGWRMMIGPSDADTARQQVPQSIRAMLGAGGRQNAVHGSDSVEAAHREIGLFFFPRIQPELDEPAASAVDDKKKKKKKKNRNKRKQAVTAGGAPEAPTGNAAALSDASDDEPELDPVPEADVGMGDGVDVSDSAVELVRPSDPAYERTFALIKPDAYPRHSKQLIKHILAKGLAVVAQEEVVLTPAVAANIYSDMSTFPVFSRLVEFVTGGPSLALVLEGVDAVSVWRELVGPTNPRTAKFEARNSLRAKYGTTAQMNAVHASKDLAEAQKSIKAVFYGLLDGKFRVLQPSDDPLAVAAEESTAVTKEAVVASEETTIAAEEAAVVTEETPNDTEEPTQPAADEHLVHQMQSLAVVDHYADKEPKALVESEISKDIASASTIETVVQSTDEAVAVDATQVSNTNGSVVYVAETASANNDDAVSVVSEKAGSVVSEKADTPLTPPQTRSATGEKSSLFGSRLASSPFLKADRHPGQDAGATPKRVGRIKSPFLGGENSSQIPADTGSKDTPTLANDNTKPSDRDAQLHEQMADLSIGAEVQEAVVVNESQESQSEEKQAEQEKSEQEQPEVKRESQSDDEETTPVQEQEEKAEPQVLAAEVPAAEKTPSKAAAPKTAPKSAAVPRTVRRDPGSGPPATASPGSGPAARRATLGPAPTTLRARPVRAAPATPSVTTRSAARASQATPSSATPSSARPLSKSGSTAARVRPDPAATTPTATRRVTALGAANGTPASPARKAVAPAPGASLVSPRPVTRSMTGGVPVASTAASRARAAAAVAARSATRAPTSSAVPAKPAPRTAGSRLTAPTAASRARAAGAAAAAKKAPEADAESAQAED